jgi:hypothetical protein
MHTKRVVSLLSVATVTSALMLTGSPLTMAKSHAVVTFSFWNSGPNLAT